MIIKYLNPTGRLAGVLILLVVCMQGGYLQAQKAEADKSSDEAIKARTDDKQNADKGEPKDFSLDLGGGAKMEFVLIPAGSFMMGDAQAGPIHKVKITESFYLGKYEVTQQQWEAVMGNNPSDFKGPQNPVEKVSWEDCQAFLKKIGKKFASTGTKFRLPTEAQWEYACRAGSTTKYCFGDDEAKLVDYAWFGKNAKSKTHPVGEKKANAWGLYDMHGNVWEWCADWYDENYYGRSPLEDPPGPSERSNRVLRGGSWRYYASVCASAYRMYDSPKFRDYRYGFRVVCVR
jgi:formylglycine-generating enzyme required for sulfatase activity